YRARPDGRGAHGGRADHPRHARRPTYGQLLRHQRLSQGTVRLAHGAPPCLASARRRHRHLRPGRPGHPALVSRFSDESLRERGSARRLRYPMPARFDASDCPTPVWLPEGHSQTIHAARLAIFLRVTFTRERVDTPDGDFIDIDWVMPGAGLERDHPTPAQ